VLEVAIAVGNQRAREEDLVDSLKKKHLEIKGSACSWEAEQQYRQIAKDELKKRAETSRAAADGSAPSSEL
jgi:hypothetical protein